MLDGLDTALREMESTGRCRRWWHLIGWRQITAQLLFVLAAVAFVTTLLCYGR